MLEIKLILPPPGLSSISLVDVDVALNKLDDRTSVNATMVEQKSFEDGRESQKIVVRKTPAP